MKKLFLWIIFIILCVPGSLIGLAIVVQGSAYLWERFIA